MVDYESVATKAELQELQERVEKLETIATTNTGTLIMLVKIIVQGNPKLLDVLTPDQRDEFRRIVGL